MWPWMESRLWCTRVRYARKATLSPAAPFADLSLRPARVRGLRLRGRQIAAARRPANQPDRVGRVIPGERTDQQQRQRCEIRAGWRRRRTTGKPRESAGGEAPGNTAHQQDRQCYAEVRARGVVQA